MQADIAKYFKITPRLVSCLVKDAQRNPDKAALLKKKQEESKQIQEAVKTVVAHMLEMSIPIVKADTVVEAVRRDNGLIVTAQQVRTIMRDQMGLGYRLIKKVPVQGNSERCLVLRQQYAMKMIPLLQEGKHIINIDESWLNETNFTHQMWCPPQTPATISLKPISHRLALIAALDTEGGIYYSLTQANTD